VLGASLIKYFENIFSAINDNILEKLFAFMPEFLQDIMVSVVGMFVGEGWHLTLGLLFMVIVIFLPGGLMEGAAKIAGLFKRTPKDENTQTSNQAAE
jgi:ABC-type branched-subunit amino acid transport system permease subunit